MRLLKDKSIQRKVTVVILVTCSAALLVTVGALFLFQLLSFRKNFEHDLSSTVEILNPYAVFAVVFKGPEPANKQLAALTAKVQIRSAEIVLLDGKVFAKYGPSMDDGRPVPGAEKPGLFYHGPYLTCAQPLIDPSDNNEIGWLYVRSYHRRAFWSLVQLYAEVVSLTLIASFGLTLLLSSRLQRVISLPILQLATTAKLVADKKDYSVRVRKLEQDEIGLLTEAFNQMLEQIQARDAELMKSRQKIETLVNSIEGVVWEADPGTLQYRFVSQQAERLLGYPAKQWLDEPEFWRAHLHPDDRDKSVASTLEAIAQMRPFTTEYRMAAANGAFLWVRNYASVIVEQGRPGLVRGVLLDITKEKTAEEELRGLHAELLLASRRAGMAEVATGVLHNVGNVLNSVNVSTAIVVDRVRRSEIASLTKVAGLLREQGDNLAGFLANDPKGKKLPAFITNLAEYLAQEQADTIRELELLACNVEHIKEIVGMQQSYARVAGMIEPLAPETLIEDALRLHSVASARAEIEIVRRFEPVPDVAVDKHRVLHILVNLFTNAQQAMEEIAQHHKKLVIGLRVHGHSVRITVSDNGVGIPPENLTRIFSHGFTTKPNGHGFGLHSGALAAKDMGGALTAYSDGLGKGADFVLELPVAAVKDSR